LYITGEQPQQFLRRGSVSIGRRKKIKRRGSNWKIRFRGGFGGEKATTSTASARMRNSKKDHAEKTIRTSRRIGKRRKREQKNGSSL